MILAQKFTFIGMDFLRQQNIVRVPVDRVDSLILTIEIFFLSVSCFGMNFPFSFGQTQCSSRLHSPRQTSPYAHSSSRSQCITSYVCHSLRMENSSRTDETILSRPLFGTPIPTQYQYTENNGHSFCTEESHKLYSPLLCRDFYRQHNSSLLYQQTRRNTFTQPMCRGMGYPLLVPGTRSSYQSSNIPGKFNILADHLSRIDKPLKTEWALDKSIANSIFQMFNYLNVDLFATRFNHKLPLYISPVPNNHALAIGTLSRTGTFFMHMHFLQ